MIAEYCNDNSNTLEILALLLLGDYVYPLMEKWWTVLFCMFCGMPSTENISILIASNSIGGQVMT